MTSEAFGIDRILQDIYIEVVDDTSGAVADYIPELAKVAPEFYGIALVSSGGEVYSIGDTSTEFTIQSTSKAITYCMALEAMGRPGVLERVGVEPSGDPFNAIEFDPVRNRPYNPMVNAGAITVAGILRDMYGAEQALDVILQRFSGAAGRQLEVNEGVYASEAATGHRNRAIAHLLLSVGALTEPVEPVLDLYFKQCSISVTAMDLATIAATVANMGEQPLTGDQIFDIHAVRDTLSVMYSCGMYDFSGNWGFDVGIPSKSGVGGGIMGVVNRQLGIGTFSPRLDRFGNSVRGIKSFKMLADELGLHSFDLTNTGSDYVSNLLRTPE